MSPRYDRYGEPLDDDQEEAPMARRLTRSIRHADAADYEDAHAEVEAAREQLQAVRRRVADGLDGASAVSLAEYRLSQALKRADRAGWAPPSWPNRFPEPEDAA